MAEALVDAGAQVAVTGRSRTRAESVASELGQGAGGYELDVRREASVETCLDQVYEGFGGVDVLINNAGIGMRSVNPSFMSSPQAFWEVSPDGFRDVIETKMTGVFLAARAIVPRMLGTGGGRVVNVSMNTQTMTRRGFVPYGPAGAGVEALSRIMAADLAETTVTVNILLPGGATATGMIPDDFPAEMRTRLLDPAIMGPPIVWLASNDASRSPRPTDRGHRVRGLARQALDPCTRTTSYERCPIGGRRERAADRRK
ncbi:MAG TPA: SDR family oxidoreductase [Solirubrobacteraceae bacterium]|jgi:gluconate 5-dehydrogenase